MRLLFSLKLRRRRRDVTRIRSCRFNVFLMERTHPRMNDTVRAHTHTLASPSICASTQGRSLSTDEKRRDRGRRSGRSGRLLTSKPTRTRGPAGRRRRRRKEKHEVDKPQREAFDIRSARPSIIQRHGAVPPPPPKKEIHPIFPFPSSFLLLLPFP